MKKKYLRYSGLTLCCLAILFLSGCGGLISRPAPLQIVILSSQMPSTQRCTQPLPVQIVVPAPEVTAGLNTERIAILISNRQVSYLSGYRWDESNAHIIQRQTIDTLNNSGCFAGAGAGSLGLRAEYRLEVEVRRMHYVYIKDETKPEAEIQLILRLIDVNKGALVGQHNVFAQVSAKDNIFDAMESAVSISMQESLDWIYNSLKAEQAKK